MQYGNALGTIENTLAAAAAGRIEFRLACPENVYLEYPAEASQIFLEVYRDR